MHLQLYILLLSLCFVLPINAQEKQIVGDTAYWFSYENRLAKKIELRNLENSSNSFEFRFSNGYQYVEIWESGDTLAGVLTSYTRKLGKKYDNPDIDTFFNKVLLPHQDLEKVKLLLEEYQMSELPSDNEIENWRMGFDGITYNFQYSSPEKLIFNSYWTPEIYDTIPEARLVSFVVDSISNLFNLKDEYENLFKTFPQKGNFGYGGTSIRVYSTGGINLGYSGSLRMPYGVSGSTYLKYLGDLRTDISLLGDFRFNKTKNYNLNFQVGKHRIFFNDNDKIADVINLFGRERRVDSIDDGEEVNGIKAVYSFSYLKTSLGLGFSQILRPKRETGLYLSLSHFIEKPKLFIGGGISKFSERIDYEFYIQRYFYINLRDNSTRIRVVLFKENFYKFSDAGIRISVLL